MVGGVTLVLIGIIIGIVLTVVGVLVSKGLTLVGEKLSEIRVAVSSMESKVGWIYKQLDSDEQKKMITKLSETTDAVKQLVTVVAASRPTSVVESSSLDNRSV